MFDKRYRKKRAILCIVYTLYYIMYISYRVTGLYRLGKTCYLHSLLRNHSIIAQIIAQVARELAVLSFSHVQIEMILFCTVNCAIMLLLHSLLCKMISFQFAHGKMITQPTLTPPQTRDW